MPTVTVPARLAGAFESAVPVAADLAELGQTGLGEFLISDAATWAQTASARLWEQLPQIVPTEGQEILSTVWTARDLAKTYANGELGDKLAAISEGGLAVVETLFEAASMVEAVPIIGMVAKVGITAQRLFWNQWVAKHKEKPPEDGFEYNRDSDVAAQQAILREIEAGDLTGVFLPFVSVEGWERRRVQDLVKGGKNRWTFVIPTGPSLGVGSVPGTNVIARGWQNAYPWSAYRPGAVNAATVAWQLALGETRARYLVDAAQLREQWDRFWTAVRVLSLNDDYKHVLKLALQPLVLRPDAGGSMWQPAFDYSNAQAAGFTADLPGLCAFNITRGLRGRQLAGLGTLLVAYVSRDDPAFRNDPELRQVLTDNRAKLLQHDALAQVDADRVADADYRQAVEAAQAAKGPAVGGLADAGAAPARAKVAKVLPTPAIPKIPSPLPDVGGEAPGRKPWPWWLKALAVLGLAGGIGGVVYSQTRK